MQVAGAWVGGEAAISGRMCERLEKLLPPYARVRFLPKQLALSTIRYCCVPLIQHWIRAHPPEVTRGPAGIFDSWIQRMVGGIADLPLLSTAAVSIMGLPLREGGLGCLPQRTIAPLAYAASQVTAITTIIRRSEERAEFFQDVHNPSISDSHMIDWLRATSPQSVKIVCAALKVKPKDIWDKPFNTQGLQRRLTTKWGGDKGMEVLLSLPTAALQVRLLDQASNIGKGWLLAIPGVDRRMHLTNADVRLALRMRLQCGVYPDYSPNDSLQCICGSPTVDWSPEHALACMHGSAKAARNLRHTYLKHSLANSMRAAGLHPQVEEQLPERGVPRVRNRAMDIVVSNLDGNSSQYIDVSVVSPLSCSLTMSSRGPITAVELVAHEAHLKAQRAVPGAKGLPAHVNPTQHAACDLLFTPGFKRAVRDKEVKYTELVRQHSQNNQMVTSSLEPFILSTGGTLCKAAHKVLGNLAQELFDRKRSTAYDYSTVTCFLRTKSFFASSLFKSLSCALVRKLSLFFRKTTVISR